jgi:hypothetical protein
MPRTTLDLDDPVLHDLKILQKKEGKSLGRLASELLAQALAARRPRTGAPVAPPRWQTTPGRVLVDLTDKEAVHAALDGAPRPPRSATRKK